jgi:putative transcriptional regulator
MTNNLRAARKAANLEQEELAALSGISQGTISRIERGSPAPSVDTALALARALGTTVEHIFGSDTQEVAPPPLDGPTIVREGFDQTAGAP